MKIYKVHYWTDEEGSEGFYYTSSLQDAKLNNQTQNGFNIKGCEKEITDIEFDLTKAEVIRLLNEHGSHNDNG